MLGSTRKRFLRSRLLPSRVAARHHALPHVAKIERVSNCYAKCTDCLSTRRMCILVTCWWHPQAVARSSSSRSLNLRSLSFIEPPQQPPLCMGSKTGRAFSGGWPRQKAAKLPPVDFLPLLLVSCTCISMHYSLLMHVGSIRVSFGAMSMPLSLPSG